MDLNAGVRARERQPAPRQRLRGLAIRRAARSPTGAPDRILPEGAMCPHGQGEQAQIAATTAIAAAVAYRLATAGRTPGVQSDGSLCQRRVKFGATVYEDPPQVLPSLDELLAVAAGFSSALPLSRDSRVKLFSFLKRSKRSHFHRHNNF